ncbi:uncharacterized protein LOC130806406 [Amaranthus tricolor]|uniref:uncharacterized protein LOC130806406 n=1 Tax=Amaranthus tricolor TaxID=29722 RepID=UPI00258E0054|nr:uncharacterized protein LOC130806406 [Amaranthus tricolor]
MHPTPSTLTSNQIDQTNIMQGRISGGGGCCIDRYTTTHPNHPSSTPTYYNHKLDHIMLRFRPIAPKPVVGGGGPSSPTTPTQNDTVRKPRKRKNNTAGNCISKGNNKRGRKSLTSPDHDYQKSNGYKVTLPLLPETPDLSPINNKGQSRTTMMPTWLSFGSSDYTAAVESTVIVEGVTDTWMDGNSLGGSEEEGRVRLDEDTCPGFISDGWNRVYWTNKAYKRMVGGEEEKVVTVKLEMREKVKLPVGKLFPAFTCRVKMVYGKMLLTVPCDAWRMDGGGFAWRLDINAALCLGLGR